MQRERLDSNPLRIDLRPRSVAETAKKAEEGVFGATSLGQL
jgi:hypothetical protein